MGNLFYYYFENWLGQSFQFGIESIHARLAAVNRQYVIMVSHITKRFWAVLEETLLNTSEKTCIADVA